MHDLHVLRTQPELVIQGLAKRGLSVDMAPFSALEQERKQAQTTLETLRAERNQNSAKAGKCKKNQDQPGFELAQQVGVALNQQIQGLEGRVESILQQQRDFALRLPNIPDERVPVGKDEHDNRVVKVVGEVKRESTPDHQSILETLQHLPMSAASLSGARFSMLEGQVARLHRALAQLMLDMHMEAGYTEVYVPYLVKAEAMLGTGQLPKFEEDLFQTTDGFFLIPTAEVPVTNLVREMMIEAEQLPLCYTAQTPCFRKEAGAAGRDVRGLIRQHQFDKVEMVRIEHPTQSEEALAELVAQAEKVLDALEVPYRVVELCTGDLGFGAKRTFDLEVWLPNQQTYREISSCSTFGDFQARRMQARFKDEQGKSQWVHTLNGSGLAVGRSLVAVLENHLQANGMVQIPEALQKYMGGQTHLVPVQPTTTPNRKPYG